MSSIREVQTGNWCIRLDLGHQVLRLEIPEAIIDWHRGRGKTDGPPLLPTLPRPIDGPVSAAALLLKAKQFDDGIYAAVEIAAQRGAGCFGGKATLLRSLAATLTAGLPDKGVDAATAIHAACQLGGVGVAVPETLIEAIRTTKATFLDDKLLSQPLSFYTWTPELSAILRQNRFLQQPLEPETADALTIALKQTPGATEVYNACLRLNARLTNPSKPLDLRDVGKRSPFFPPSRSHEVTLLERLYSDRPIPDGFDLMGELIRRVRSGDVRLMPTAESGWYDHQTWSLEPLLVPDRRPEAARLELGKRYRKHLEELFRGALALTRETHARQAGGGRGGYAGLRRQPIRIRPCLSVEPLPTVYTRRAASYRFVRSVLEDVFGIDGLAVLHRLTPDGSITTSLAEELAWIEELFAGAAATAMQELGMGVPDRGETVASRFAEWRAKPGLDADMSRDARMMVPVFYDELKRRTKVWALLGWRTIAVDVEYRVPPNVLAIECSQAAGEPSTDPPPVQFTGDRYEFAVPVMAEVYVSCLLNRDEFRRHCDRYKTREAILANLS